MPGVRARWVGRGVSTTLVACVAVMMLGLFTSLPDPGLPGPTSGNAELQEPNQSSAPAPSAAPPSPSPTPTATSSARRAAEDDPTPAPSTAPTSSPTTSSDKDTDTSGPAPHKPGTRPTEPPGKAK